MARVSLIKKHIPCCSIHNQEIHILSTKVAELLKQKHETHLKDVDYLNRRPNQRLDMTKNDKKLFIFNYDHCK